MLSIDLNCDLGESYGAYQIGSDRLVLPWVSSVNIACGFHAGSPTVMRETVELARQAGVSIGAHPGLPDREGFGRRAMGLSEMQIYDTVLYQVAALAGVAKACGAKLRHVKPHGELYNCAARRRSWADAIAAAVADFDRSLLLYVLSGSEMVAAARRQRLVPVQEIFADRSYQNDGSLTPRSQKNALLDRKEDAGGQVLHCLNQGVVFSVEHLEVPLQADTVCLHGDGPHALEFAQYLRQFLQQHGVRIQSPTTADS